MHHIRPVQPPPQQHQRLIRFSGQCNNASFMGIIFLWHFIIDDKGGLTTYSQPQSFCYYTLTCSVTVCTGGTKQVWVLHPAPSSCPIPPFPQKISFQGLHTSSRHWCLPPWLPGLPMRCMSATQVRSPCQGSQHCMDAHTGTGWAGRTPAWHRHCSDAQSNQDNC